jgi:ABC-type branched-subunit amino acid transport system ATPase component
MAFQFSLPISSGNLSITIEPGSSAIFVGANGGGKTRLAVYIEEAMGIIAHRISAHRALALNPEVPKVSERTALSSLRLGLVIEGAEIAHRTGHRWQQRAATNLLNDFDFVIQALFAEQGNRSLDTHQRNRAGDHTPAKPTNFERLVEIWNRLLPHRLLHVSGDNVEVSAASTKYKASEMSDGERAIFYMIGQALTAAKNSLLIIDEPELHVHRSIMSKLWDELEAARPDCGFVFITHDLEFAAARIAQKFVISDYDPAPRWTIEVVPEDTGFSEELTTLILGIVLTQVRQTDGRHGLQTQQLCCLDAPMPGNDLVIVVDQNGIVEAETLDTPSNLLDLLRRVRAGVARVRSQRVGRPVFEVHIGSPFMWKNLDRPVVRRRRSARRKVLICDQDEITAS